MSLRKRQKLDLEALEDSIPDIIGEIDLEIGFRQRLARTLESRITWALILQEALQSDRNGHESSTTSFKDVAIDTLSSIEAPSEFLFVREAGLPTQVSPQQTYRRSRPPPKAKVPIRNASTTFLYIRSADLEPQHGENRIQTYLLRCPTCFRTTFTSLQGLLNHGRISHNQEWGSHDECVRACAVADPSMDVSAGIEVGLGPVGILPGLRSLFQRAVGAQPANGPSLEAVSVAELPGAQPQVEPTLGLHLARTLGLHKDTPALAPFLGKQPTRRGIKMWDNDGVVDIDGFGDKDSRSESHATTSDGERKSIKRCRSKRWRMAYMHRNDVKPITASDNAAAPHSNEQISKDIHSAPGGTSSVDSHVEETRTSKVEPTEIALASLPTPGTRFHFVARIVMTDRSLYIDRRQKTAIGHTHMWMISVDSPSYSHHITTILQRITVTSLTHPDDFPALTQSSPPFAVVGTTDEPFLASVELCFSGALGTDGQITSQTMVLEHWVELDLVKFTSPAVGEEQVVDVELDKATILMPIQTDYTPVDSKALWNLDLAHRELNKGIDGSKSKNGAQDERTEGYAKILTSLLDKFPMTLKDTPRGRPPNPPLPYKLVSTPTQLKNLILGRRKAIEWGRARALWDAYTQVIQDPQTTREGAISLTTADVFAWLSDEGHFVKRPAVNPPMKEPVDKQEDKPMESWCPVCGQGVDVHLMTDTVKQEAATFDTKEHTTVEGETKEGVRYGDRKARAFPYSCGIVPAELHRAQMPVIDVRALFGPRPPPLPYNYAVMAPKIDDAPANIHAFNRSRVADVVTACDPHISLAIERVISPLQLPTFKSSLCDRSSSRFPLDMMGTNKAAVETHLAPYATLGLAMRRFVRMLIEGGVEVAKGEKAIAAGLTAPRRRKRVEKEKDSAISMLTPAHITRGIVLHGRERGQAYGTIDVAVFGSLARLRVPADVEEPSADGTVRPKSESTQSQSERSVKTEQP